jgi:ERF superfamily protein
MSSDPRSDPASLARALVAAQQAVDVAGKDATNKHHGYDYASAEEIVAVGSAALGASGLAFSEESSAFEPFAIELLRRAERGEKPYPDGIGGALGVLTVVYELSHESGERRAIRHVFPVVPEKGRPLDKALAAARTECLAYALRGLLLMQRRAKGQRKARLPDVSGRGDVPDHDQPKRATLAAGTASVPPVVTGPAAAPVSTVPSPRLLKIESAQTGEEALVALTEARQDRAADPELAEQVFSRWLCAKAAAARTEETFVRIDGALARASLSGKLAKKTRETIAQARKARGAGA